jgi:hypothetical protein
MGDLFFVVRTEVALKGLFQRRDRRGSAEHPKKRTFTKCAVDVLTFAGH